MDGTSSFKQSRENSADMVTFNEKQLQVSYKNSEKTSLLPTKRSMNNGVAVAPTSGFEGTFDNVKSR